MEIPTTLGLHLESLGSRKLTIYGSLCDLNTYINNNRKNRYLGAKSKRESQDICCLYIKNQLRDCKFDRVFLTFTWYCQNKKKDPDNIAFCKKYILDAMVECGVLKNDGWKQVAGFLDLFQVGEDRVEIDIYPLK